MSKKSINIFWFRRDLRLYDNAGLYHALKSDKPVLCIFIFDADILTKLDNSKDARVLFIHDELTAINNQLHELGSTLISFHGSTKEVWQKITDTYKVGTVFANRDYEPYARERDKNIYDFLKEKNIEFKGYKDQVIFEKEEVMKDDGKPYTVFTPYSRKWKLRITPFYLKSYPTKKYFGNLCQLKKEPIIDLKTMGFEEFDFQYFPDKTPAVTVLKKYDLTRDFPAIEGTSRISLHLRFGTISVREITRLAFETNEKWLNELIWREFYQMILFHFPYSVNSAFKPQYNAIVWRNNEHEFRAWCEGKTGYPIVDAGMRELNTTGHMHNRVRMVVASFLVKHLLIDWKWGERYFASKLLDFDLASNVGGWQWAAGSGCDAAPYFRVFNPALQTEKFDHDELYIKKWVPEYKTSSYPKPIVEHSFARDRCLTVFKQALSGIE